MKEDPEVYERYLQAAKKRYHDRKDEGGVKKSSELTERAKRMKRKKDRNYQRHRRLNMKSEKVEQVAEQINQAGQSNHTLSAQKKFKKKKRKCYDENHLLRSNNTVLDKKVKALQKKLIRIKASENKSKNLSMPELKVKTMLGKRIVDKDIHGRLVNVTVPHNLRIQLMCFISNNFFFIR